MTGRIKSAVRRIYAFVNSPKGESVRYVIIGGMTTLVDYASYYLMLRWLGIGVTAGNIASTVLAVLFAYVTNKIYVFRSRTETFGALAAELIKFTGARLLTMGLEVGGVYLLVNILGQDKLLGKAETIVAVIVVNYFLSKFLVFKSRRS